MIATLPRFRETRTMRGLLLGLFLGSLPVPLHAQAPPLGPTVPIEALREMTVARVVQQFDARWQHDLTTRRITAAPRADDAEFVRRVYLDLMGRIPYVSETRAFLSDDRADKREQLIEQLLARPGFAQHWAATWRAEWLPMAENNPQLIYQAMPVETWLRNRLRDNTPYDQVVRQLLMTSIANGRVNQVVYNAAEPLPYGFYQLHENKPENIAGAVTRLFMGVKLECAQCHDHPFANYTREQFWETAAFFTSAAPVPQPVGKAPVSGNAANRTIRIPNTDRLITAKFIDGHEPDWTTTTSPREHLANWLTRDDNPYFARNLSNRLWCHFFGHGILDPVDEPSDTNLPSHPELLALLRQATLETRYDIKQMIRIITRSQAYGLSSRQTDPTQANPRAFARMSVRGISAEQFWDSLVVATGYRDPTPIQQRRLPYGNSPRNEFLTRFSTTERPTEQQTSILQALMLMNGKFVADQTHLDRSELLAAVIDMPFAEIDQRVETLFLACLTRKPTALEIQRFRSYIERHANAKQAYGDVFWALLNSSEFSHNH